MEPLNALKGVKKLNIKPQVDSTRLKDCNSIFVLRGQAGESGLRDGPSSFVMSNSFANQTLAQLDLWKTRTRTKSGIYILPTEETG